LTALTEGAARSRGGWLGQTGISWQVVPARFEKLLSTGDPARRACRQALFQMKKIIIADLESAAAVRCPRRGQNRRVTVMGAERIHWCRLIPAPQFACPGCES
jgi:hypothetical protein